MPFGSTAFWPATLLPAGPVLPAGMSAANAAALVVQALLVTTLPSRSNSTTGGDALDLNGPPSVPVLVSAPPTPSGEARPPVWKPRVTMKRWSRESMQVPPTSPVTQLSGSGLGQNGSTLNVGATSACLSGAAPRSATGLRIAMLAAATPAATAPRYTYRLASIPPPV